MNSFNHYAYGAVGDWMVSTVAGLQFDPQDPGYKHIIFKPRPGGTLTWAEARLKTPQGEVAIRWELKEGALELALEVPAGARATVSLLEGWGGVPATFGPGSHRAIGRATK
jgi:alpha-L-rhamnosidase